MGEAVHMDAEDLIDPEDARQFTFELANGNHVKIVFAEFWEPYHGPAYPLKKYFGIKLYCNEDLRANRLAVRHIFRAGEDFAVAAVPTIWDWLGMLVKSREYLVYDWYEEFEDEFGEQIARFSEVTEDAVDHIAHLPELNLPGVYDHDADDSAYNDPDEPAQPK